MFQGANFTGQKGFNIVNPPMNGLSGESFFIYLRSQLKFAEFLVLVQVSNS